MRLRKKAVQDPVVYGFGKTGSEHIIENWWSDKTFLSHCHQRIAWVSLLFAVKVFLHWIRWAYVAAGERRATQAGASGVTACRPNPAYCCSVNQVWVEHSQSSPFTVAAFVQHRWAVATETIWPEKSKILTDSWQKTFTFSYSRSKVLPCGEIADVQLPCWAQISMRPSAIFLQPRCPGMLRFPEGRCELQSVWLLHRPTFPGQWL